MTKALMNELAQLRREPLLAPRARPDATPGIYLLWVGSTRDLMIDLFGETASGVRPLVCGVGTRDVWSRVGRYRQLLGDLPGIDLDEVWVSVSPCSSGASALYAEALVIDATAPIANAIGSGVGSMRPGSGRRGQRAATIDALFPPGRPWSRPPSQVEQIRARCLLLAHLARTDPAGPRWPSLIP